MTRPEQQAETAPFLTIAEAEIWARDSLLTPVAGFRSVDLAYAATLLQAIPEAEQRLAAPVAQAITFSPLGKDYGYYPYHPLQEAPTALG